jgi:hypothetical protein
MTEISYHHRKQRKRSAGWLWFWLTLLLIFVGIAGFIAWDVLRTRSEQQSGDVLVSQFEVDRPAVQTIQQDTYSFELPADWVEVKRFNNKYDAGITWQATAAKQDNRYLTIYLNKLPTKLPVNRMLPVESIGRSLRHGPISDNCAKYTPGGKVDANAASKARPVIAKWDEVEFICDLPKVFDNVVGTSSSEGINSVSITGPEKGTHKYFFLYTDHNIHPNYEIFLNVIESFRAK